MKTPWISWFSRPLASLLLLGSLAAGHAQTPSGAPAVAPLRIYAIWDGISTSNEAKIREQMDELLRQFGPGNAYHKPGFAFIFQNRPQTEMIAKAAGEKGLSIGLIINIQSHSQGKEGHDFFSRDLRSFQWRMKSNNWEGYFTGHNNSSSLEIADDSRDHCVPSPSRYSPLAREYFPAQVRRRARDIREIMQGHPGVITCINGVIEEELAVAAASIKGPEADDYLADYSPFAIAEFRDWLRHTGMYDDSRRPYAGQGAPATITGPFLEIRGKKRSPFYADSTPASHWGGGKSFNETFGTHFTTWNLKYWDPVRFPQPITDPAFHPMPKPGEAGDTEGGFDAPRQCDRSRWWRAWSWDYLDEGSTYPPGNPAVPAFGFRQQMVAHFVQDMFEVMAAEGLPREIMYAHQIPGEQVGAARCRSSASPVWTGYLPACGTVGATNFGRFDSWRALQYLRLSPHPHGWGIFEWHPRPHSKPEDPQFYAVALQELTAYSQSGCRHLFAGWWSDKPDPIFPLKNSQFARAIKVFMASTPDHLPAVPGGADQETEKIR